jgi:hypothetical protein
LENQSIPCKNGIARVSCPRSVARQIGANQVIEQIELGLVKRLVIGSQDRFVRFGYDWFEQFCERHGTQITVINGETFSPEEELVRDLIAIVTVFSPMSRRPLSAKLPHGLTISSAKKFLVIPDI